MTTGFKADCTINFHVESLDKSGRLAWSCSIVHYKRGRVVVAAKAAGNVAKEEAQLEAILFGLWQTKRLLQEKVDVAASFPLQGILPEAGSAPQKKTKMEKSDKTDGKSAQLREDIGKAWEGFRLRRIVKMVPGEAEILRKEASQA